jgi:hypothetical protein
MSVERMAANPARELGVVGARDLEAAITAQSLVVRHSAADTPRSGLDDGKSVAGSRQEEFVSWL